MVNRLPRNVDDNFCVNVHIKQKKIHRTSYLICLVTKRTIKAWLQYLVATPLYRMYDVTIDNSFFNLNHSMSQVPQDEISENITIKESLTAQQQTLLWNEEKYLCIAPGEANVPRSLLFDEHVEELSFSAIYLGHFRNFREGVRVTLFMIATSELRHVDRCGVTPQHLP
ncbi:ATP-dependent DNA helicase [Trichonephila inaurata madagascariensis]|uniref:ATP-dependent DNA helicase n=1 Tax=Trichonephila inaurata madagascariensis TaxID=2747483 RepID=A0A8X6WUT9_9ARAC|nr:ATP-dependent DNA helicase [Trichonephila inaurata madagascariensis]